MLVVTLDEDGRAINMLSEQELTEACMDLSADIERLINQLLYMERLADPKGFEQEFESAHSQ